MNDCDYKLLKLGVARVLKALDFDSLDVLMDTRDCLNVVVNENAASDCSDDISIVTVHPTDTMADGIKEALCVAAFCVETTNC